MRFMYPGFIRMEIAFPISISFLRDHRVVKTGHLTDVAVSL